MFGRSVRTNNDVEVWHNRLNRRTKKGNLPFCCLLSLLYSDACEIPTLVHVKLAKEGKLRRHQEKYSKCVQGRLVKLCEKYNNNEISAYLMDLQQKFSKVGVYFHYISCCGFTRF